MAYTSFHRPHHHWNPSPVFLDSDGSPVYELPQQGLLSQIISGNDLVALKSYNDCPNTDVFWKTYEFDDSNPFHIAIHSDNFDILCELVRIYFSDTSLTEPLQDYIKRHNVSPVVKACATGNQEMVLWLMNHNPLLGTLEDRDLDCQTAIFRAVEGLKEVGALMLQAQYEGNRALPRRKLEQRWERMEPFISWLLDMNCPMDVEAENIEGKEKNEENDKQLPRDECEYHSVLRETVLGEAVSHASYSLVSRLISKGADPYARQRWHGGNHFAIEYAGKATPLHIAALSGNVEAFDHRLFGKNTNMVSVLDDEGRIPLHWALAGVAGIYGDMVDSEKITSRMAATVKLLLDFKLDTLHTRDKVNATVFHYAVKNNTGNGANIEAITILLGAARDCSDILNSRDNSGATPLGNLIESHQLIPGGLKHIEEITGLLLKHGAHARGCDEAGRNILQILCSLVWLELISSTFIDQLLQQLDVNEKDERGCTALHYLVKNFDQADAVRHLLSQGADVNAVDQEGNTPLHEVMKGTILRRQDDQDDPVDLEQLPTRLKNAQDKMIQILLTSGASEAILNGKGETPRQVQSRVLEERARRLAAQQVARGRGRGRAVR
ncbi:hypothetical protein PENPOL_c022G03881 [Penicillium polonicum]|uniref:Uncharacterized protein n=1 Tax=Penicillium polonicum TaxID=60169 RepID=A0A1V6N7D6_PENPO|nr:hypothetical protein PENPOL_c022G03881 [Penicillium polonicum]